MQRQITNRWYKKRESLQEQQKYDIQTTYKNKKETVLKTVSMVPSK